MGSYRFDYKNDISTRKPIMKYKLPNVEIRVLSTPFSHINAPEIGGTPMFHVYMRNTETNHEKLETYRHGRDAINRANELYEEHQKATTKITIADEVETILETFFIKGESKNGSS